MLTLLLLACALTADGFAVSVCRAAGTNHNWRMAAWNGLIFGITHVIMLGLGSIVGELLGGWRRAAPWVTMIVLLFLGLKMLTEALRSPENDDTVPAAQLGTMAFAGLVMAATVTSVDCMAAGVGLTTLHLSVTRAMVVLGIVTTLACGLGYQLGGIMGSGLGKRAEIGGGLILIGLALRAVLYP